jgi:hypothetical protein
MSQKLHDFTIFEKYIPRHEWPSVSRVVIKYNPYNNFKFLSFFNIYWFKRYYLKIIYKNDFNKPINISVHEKDVLKPELSKFNFYLSTL